MGLSEDLLDILVCPKCKGSLDYQEKEERLVCKACRLAYPVENDIPIMLIDTAHTWAEEESGLLDKAN
ncbi:MAG: Trm112 family protein [Fidelibacterota bacterium]|nr:MAG: Trm112 family protein [Candidatus Neomarinimicrobiota bacterium]